MGAALILYGSRARDEARPESDIDIILAEDGMSLRPPRTGNGVSIHLYSKGWLEAEAQSGSLFAYHVAHEGIALHDEDGFLNHLQRKFRKKPSYTREIEIAALILKLILENGWNQNDDARRRYFWAIRTIVISNAADHGNFIFGSAALEMFSKILGLAAHIDAREHAAFYECAKFGQQVLSIVGAVQALEGAELRNRLTALGGIARDSVRIFEEREAIEAGNLSIYL